MDFGKLPPEVNFGRARPGSLQATAVALRGLTAGMRQIGAECSSIAAGLTSGWRGPAAVPVMRVIAPHWALLTALARHASQTAIQAETAAQAYEQAAAKMTSAQLIASNRMMRKWLSANNFLGQASPVIAELEAEYDRVWVHCADAVHDFAGALAISPRSTPLTSQLVAIGFTRLAHRGSPVACGTAAMDSLAIMTTGTQVVSSIPRALKALSAPYASLGAAISPAALSLSRLSSVVLRSNLAARTLHVLETATASGLARTTVADSGGSQLLVDVDHATSIGALSVPQAWITAIAASPVVSVLQRTGWICEPIGDAVGSEPPG
ncbi:PPE family protein [Mycobacterium marinum]|uniref:PPE family protein n=1 Tax=Mycobacterium marinum TaxID=1781 RepID=UPI00356A227B